MRVNMLKIALNKS